MCRLSILLIILLMFSCKEEKVESFQLKDINLDLVANDSICFRNTFWRRKGFFEDEIQKYLKKYDTDLFEKVLVAHFSSEGEVIDYNTLVMLSFKNGETKVIREGRKSIDSLVIDEYSLKYFTSKFKESEYAAFPNQIIAIEFKKGNFECFSSQSYSGAVFESLKNLDFFNKKKLDLAIASEKKEWAHYREKYMK